MSKPQQHAHVPEEKRAAEYLANERTFLAWIRTSIAVIGAGFVISRFTVLLYRPADSPKASHKSVIVGVVMMILGVVLSLLALWRYHVVNRCIEEGRVKADRALVILVSVLVVVLGAGMIAFILFVPESK